MHIRVQDSHKTEQSDYCCLLTLEVSSLLGILLLDAPLKRFLATCMQYS